MNTLEFIMKVEEEGFDPTIPEEVEALQGMIDTGIVWQLQGSWQRFATRMIQAQVVNPKDAVAYS